VSATSPVKGLSKNAIGGMSFSSFEDLDHSEYGNGGDDVAIANACVVDKVGRMKLASTGIADDAFMAELDDQVYI
jgi:hypothetical protein